MTIEDLLAACRIEVRIVSQLKYRGLYFSEFDFILILKGDELIMVATLLHELCHAVIKRTFKNDVDMMRANAALDCIYNNGEMYPEHKKYNKEDSLTVFILYKEEIIKGVVHMFKKYQNEVEHMCGVILDEKLKAISI